VSDLRRPLEGCVVTARLAWTGDARGWRFGGDVGADECVLVGHLRATVPDAAGPLSLTLELDGPAHATNVYETTISSRST
jgi:hypothetical protein